MSKNLLFALTLFLVSSLANAAQVICEWNGLTCMNPTITPVTQLNEEFTVAGKPPNYIIGMISLNLWKSRPYLSYAPTKMFNIMPGIVYFGTSSSAPKMTLVTNSIANCSVMAHMEFLDANIGTIPEGFAQTCNNIRNLIIVRAGVDKVHKNAFKGMTKMEILYMSDNKISCLPPELFQTIPNLIALDMQRNMIKSLDSKLFKNLPRLNNINFDSNLISYLPLFDFTGTALNETLRFLCYNNSINTFNPNFCNFFKFRPANVQDGFEIQETIKCLTVADGDFSIITKSTCSAMLQKCYSNWTSLLDGTVNCDSLTWKSIWQKLLEYLRSI